LATLKNIGDRRFRSNVNGGIVLLSGDSVELSTHEALWLVGLPEVTVKFNSTDSFDEFSDARLLSINRVLKLDPSLSRDEIIKHLRPLKKKKVSLPKMAKKSDTLLKLTKKTDSSDD
jgi:hypothetical protein